MKHIHLTIRLRREVRLTRNAILGLCACTAMLIALLAFPNLSHATGDADRGKELLKSAVQDVIPWIRIRKGQGFAGSTADRQAKFRVSNTRRRCNQHMLPGTMIHSTSG